MVSPEFKPLVSPHFRLEEVACRCGCGYWVINDVLVWKLEALRARIGHKPLVVHSWCRCEEHNRRVGGVPGSLHIYGMAADVSSPGVSLAELARQADGLFDGVGVYWGQGFVHVDVRGWRSRWQE